tara:strand:+ start:298 stop:510 length:213 start_codon:yes stop_codon:yes gene_type:complete
MNKKPNNLKISSLDIVCASDFEEFYYTHNDEPVPEGEPVGIDFDTPDGVHLNLFDDVYWSPSYPTLEDDE